MQRMINVGVVGFGLAGQVFHAPFIRLVEGMRLAAIVRRSGGADPYPGVAFVRSVDELLALPDIGLVVVATPNDTHVPIARQCLLAGRDVVIDKPFAPTLRDAEELASLARSRRRLLTVFQNRRWDGDFKTVQALLVEGKLGRVVLFESHFDRYRPALRGTWREKPGPGSGLLFDLGPHLLDQALALFGHPEAITADVRSERDGAVTDDAFDLTLHYPGMRAVLRASALRTAPGPRYWICGAAATFTKYGLDPQEDALKEGGDPGRASWGTEPETAWGTLTSESDSLPVPTLPGNYRGYYENVRDAILGKAPIDVTLDQALVVMRLLELAAESSRTGRRVECTR